MIPLFTIDATDHGLAAIYWIGGTLAFIALCSAWVATMHAYRTHRKTRRHGTPG